MAYAERNHVKDIICYVAFLLIQSLATYSFDIWLDTNYAYLTWILQGLYLLFVLYFFILEGRQFLYNYYGPSITNKDSKNDSQKNLILWIMEWIMEHFWNACDHVLNDIWNGLELAAYIFALIGIILRIIAQDDTKGSRGNLAAASVIFYFKILYYLRPFSGSGFLISMILKISMDIRFFLLILTFVLIGFSQAFWLLNNDGNNIFSGIGRSFLSTYLFMLGNFDETVFDSGIAPKESYILLCLFLLFMTILMLNLLIALMGDTFERVKAQDRAYWRYEQAKIILENANSWENKIASYMYVLRNDEQTDENISYVEEDAAGSKGLHINDDDDDDDNPMMEMKREMKEIKKQLSESMKEVKEQLDKKTISNGNKGFRK